MNKNLAHLFAFITCIFTINSVFAIANITTINMAKTEYTVNESVMINITITPIQTFNGRLVVYFAMEGADNYVAESFIKQLSLNSGIIERSSFSMRVSENTPPGKYNAIALVFDNNDNLIDGKNASFAVAGTKQEIDIELFECSTQFCGKKYKMFLKNDDVHLYYESPLSGLNVLAAIKYPDGSTRNLNLPTSIKADQLGTYTVTLVSSKSGYKTTTIEEKFGVIEAHAVIGAASVCNNDGVCSGQENNQNCPQDCLLAAADDTACDNTSDEKCEVSCLLSIDPDCMLIQAMLCIVFGLIIVSVLVVTAKHRRRKSSGKGNGWDELEKKYDTKGGRGRP